MTLFDAAGHLTQEALQAWQEGSLCAEQRLLLAEHLSVCDVCLLRMAQLEPESGPELSPPPEKNLVGAAVNRAHGKKWLEILKRCGIVAAAAVFAFGFLRLDLLGMKYAQPMQPAQPPTQTEEPAPGAMQKFAVQLSEGIFDWGLRFSATVLDTLTVDRENEPTGTTQMTQRSGDNE